MITATNLVGDYGVPSVGVFKKGETREVSLEVAARLKDRREFRISAEADDLPFRDETGKVRYLGYTGPVDSRFGYGGAGITVLRALTRLGIEASVNNHHNGQQWEPHRGDLPADAVSQLVKRPWLPRLELCHSVPVDFRYATAPVRVGWTMFETNKIPDGTRAVFGPNWTPTLNAMDALVVPCHHNAEVFANCGVTRPITVIPYGLDTEIWPYFERPLDRPGPFTVVQYGDLNSRKGVEEAVEAFQKAFSGQTDVRLVLKTQHRGILPQYAKLNPNWKDSRIVIVTETWTRAQLVAMLHGADCFIWPSRGEGFGLPPLQALLTGLPVVMTTNTGMAEYYKPQFFYGIRDAGMSRSPMGGEWYEPDVEHAAEQLRKVYDDPKAALKRAKAGATYVRNSFSLEAFADRLGAYLAAL